MYNHIFYYVRTSIFYILSLGEIYLFLYNTVEQLFWRVREEDQVTLFGAKMLGFFGVKIEMYLSSFHVCRLAFKMIIFYMQLLYCLLLFPWILYTWKGIVGVYGNILPTALNSRFLFWFLLCQWIVKGFEQYFNLLTDESRL